MNSLLFIAMLIATVTPTATKTATPKPTPTAPTFTYATPAPAPTPVGSLLISGTPTHGVPLTINEQEAGAPVLVNGNLQGYTNSVGNFKITFPTAGTYTLNVGDYPQQTLVVQ